MVDVVFIEEGNAPAVARHPTSWDGTRGPNNAENLYTPIASQGDYIYLAENTWAPGSGDGLLVGGVAQIDKDLHHQIDRRPLGQQSWDGPGFAGHSSGAVGVTGDGQVLARRGGHTTALSMYREVTPGLLSSIAQLVPDPAGADTRADYRRFWRAPDGRVWLYVRGNDRSNAELYIWDPIGDELIRQGAPFADWGTSTGAYAVNLCWDPDTPTTMYAAISINRTQPSGFPDHYIGVVKSVDNGASWTDMDDNALTLPLAITDITRVAGSLSVTTEWVTQSPQIAVDPDGNPILAFGWRQPGEDLSLATYTARWNGTGWDYVRIYPELGDGSDVLAEWNAGKLLPQLVRADDLLVLVMTEVGEGVTQRLVVLVQYPDDDPEEWHRWVLWPDNLYTGAYIDPWSLIDDHLLRIYPVTNGDLWEDGDPLYDPISEIWELPVRGIDVWAERRQYDDIDDTEYCDDDDIEPTEYYRYRVLAYDPVTQLFSEPSEWVFAVPPFDGTVEAATDLTGVLSIPRNPGGPVEAATEFVAEMVVTRTLAGAVEAATDFSGALSGVVTFEGSVDAVTDLTAELATTGTVDLTGAIETATDATGGLQVTRAAAGAAEAATDATAALSVSRPLTGAVEAATDAVADFDVAGSVTLAGQVDAATDLTAAAAVTRTLTGTVSAATDLTAELTVTGQTAVDLAGSVAAATDLVGALAVHRPLAGAVEAATDLVAEFDTPPDGYGVCRPIMPAAACRPIVG